MLIVWLLLAATVLSAADRVAPPGALSPSEINTRDEGLLQLVSVRRVYVDRLTGGETAAQMRDLIISSLQSSKLFTLTENQSRADAILRGAAEDLVFTEVHSSNDSINAHTNFGTGRSSRSSGRSGYSSYGGDSINAGVSLGESESEHMQERRHEAMATVRLVNKDGDVIWSTTQESLGGKFRGSSADVADKITRSLLEDFERARKQLRSPP